MTKIIALLLLHRQFSRETMAQHALMWLETDTDDAW